MEHVCNINQSLQDWEGNIKCYVILEYRCVMVSAFVDMCSNDTGTLTGRISVYVWCKQLYLWYLIIGLILIISSYKIIMKFAK